MQIEGVKGWLTEGGILIPMPDTMFSFYFQGAQWFGRIYYYLCSSIHCNKSVHKFRYAVGSSASAAANGYNSTEDGTVARVRAQRV